MAGDLVQAIKEKKQRIVDLKREIVALEAELTEAKSLLAAKPKKESAATGFRKRPIRQKSSVWWATQVLKHGGGRPIHIDELVKRVEEFGGLAVRKSTLVSNLSRYVRAHDTFSRPTEGTYGLLDEQAQPSKPYQTTDGT
jgi:hypothetical protein